MHLQTPSLIKIEAPLKSKKEIMITNLNLVPLFGFTKNICLTLY